MKIGNVDIFKVFVSIAATLYFIWYSQDYQEWHFIDSVNLVFHEAGHTLTAFFPHIIYVLSGSVLQLLIPLIFVIYFLYDRQYFSGSLLLFWVGQNCINISYYIADAILMQLPLLGGDSSIHDWNFILSHFNILSHAPSIAHVLYTLGTITIFVAAGLCFYFSRTIEQFDVRDF